MPSIFTRSGDDGTTGRLDGARVCKDDPLIELEGTIQECSALIGVARSLVNHAPTDKGLRDIQCQLVIAGSDVSNVQRNPRFPAITPKEVTELEALIIELESQMPKLTQFILPAGCQASAMLHLACAVCRRLERRAVALSRQQQVSEALLSYFNRLSDALFILARYVQDLAGGKDEVYFN